VPGEPGRRDGDERAGPDEVGADHQPLPVEAVGGDPAVQPEDERRDAVREPNGDHPERAGRLEREPHQRDVVQRVAELAGCDREVQAAKVAAPEERHRAHAPRRRDRLELAWPVEDGIGHGC
jgi:hypothetical protein